MVQEKIFKVNLNSLEQKVKEIKLKIKIVSFSSIERGSFVLNISDNENFWKTISSQSNDLESNKRPFDKILSR